jgi:hypothetical protein
MQSRHCRVPARFEFCCDETIVRVDLLVTASREFHGIFGLLALQFDCAVTLAEL